MSEIIEGIGEVMSVEEAETMANAEEGVTPEPSFLAPDLSVDKEEVPDTLEDYFYAIFGMFPANTFLVAGGTDFDRVQSDANNWLNRHAFEWCFQKGIKADDCELVIALRLARGAITEKTTSPTHSLVIPIGELK